MSALRFKECKFNASVYYFINEKTRELVIAIISIYNIYFIGFKNSLLLLELKLKDFCRPI